MTAGKFEVYEDKAGLHRFRLRAANGEIVASGEAYPTRNHAHRGVAAVLTAAGFSEEAAKGAVDGTLVASALDSEASPARVEDI